MRRTPCSRQKPRPRAPEIDDTIAEAHAALGVIRTTSECDWEPEQSFGRAIERHPITPTARNWCANYLRHKAGPTRRSAKQRRQSDSTASIHGGWASAILLLLARRYAESVDAESSASEMNPHFWLAHWVLGLAYQQLGDQSGATAAPRVADPGLD